MRDFLTVYEHYTRYMTRHTCRGGCVQAYIVGTLRRAWYPQCSAQISIARDHILFLTRNYTTARYSHYRFDGGF